MKLPYGVFIDFKLPPAFVYEFQSISVASDFCFIPISKQGFAEYHCGDPRTVNSNAFQAVGGYGALDKGMFSERFEFFGGTVA
jgi:hypothetical protein